MLTIIKHAFFKICCKAKICLILCTLAKIKATLSIRLFRLDYFTAFLFKTLGTDLIGYTNERDAPIIIGAFSLVSILVDRCYNSGLPLLWRLPSPTCYLSNTSQPTNTSHIHCFQHFRSDTILTRCFFNDLITVFTCVLVN